MTGRDALQAALDRLCPMHLWLEPGGAIRHAAPTLLKLRPRAALVGQAFDTVFSLLRPRPGPGLHGALPTGQRLQVQFRDAPATAFNAIALPAPGGGLIVNLGFRMTAPEALRDYTLASADFAPTDPTVEMLFLIEAKSAAMEAQRHLNLRLQGAALVAEEQAQTDPLTGLKNLRALQDVLSRLVNGGEGFALMHVDLDHFKAVNDSFGHDAGDHVLRGAARIMQSVTREGDTVARIGGDEFLLVLPGRQDRDRLSRIAARLIAGLERPVRVRDHICRVSASIGIALSEDAPGAPPDDLIRHADAALYASKRAGRGRFTFAGTEAANDKAGSA